MDPSQSSPLQPVAQDRSDSSDRSSFIRRNLKNGALGLVALVGLLLVLGIWAKEPLAAFARTTAAGLGLGGLTLFVFLTDAITSPVPPDVALVVVSETGLSQLWWWFVPFLGAVSVLGGNVGYFVAYRMGHLRVVKAMLRRTRKRHAERVSRYGGLAVVLGAITPIPFSITCWSAGFLRLPWPVVFRASLLRIPRFVFYYLVISQSFSLVGVANPP